MANYIARPIFEEVTFNWVFTTKLDRFDKYSVQVVMSKEQVPAFAKLGVNIKPAADGSGKFVCNLSRKPSNAKGQPRTVNVVDKAGMPLKEIVANGSKGYVVIEEYDYLHPTTKATTHGCNLIGIQVTELVKYEMTEPTFDVIGALEKETKPSELF